MHAENRLASALALALLGTIAGVGIGLIQQHRTVARLEARHREDQARLSAQIDAVRSSVEAVHAELGEARNRSAREDQRLGTLVHDLDRRFEQLRQVTEPMVAEATEALEAPFVAQ